MRFSITSAAIACAISALFFTPCFAASSSGVSVGWSEGISDSSNTHADGSSSTTVAWSQDSEFQNSVSVTEHHSDFDESRFPLKIIQKADVPFSLSVSPKKLDTTIDKDIELVFDSPDADIAFIGLTYRDPYSKTLRHMPIVAGKPFCIVSREHVREAAENTRLNFVVTKKDGTSSIAVVDLHIARAV